MAKLLTLKQLSGRGLHRLLLRDGLVYYIVITTLRLLNLIMFVRGDSSTVYMALFLTLGLGSTLVSRMVLNLRSWSQHSAHYGDDAGWRFDGPPGNHHEMHGMVALATRESKYISPRGDLDISVHIDVPVRGPMPTYNMGAGTVEKPLQRRIMIKRETVIIVDDDELSTKKGANAGQDV